jgi:kynurenine formamidase
MDRVAPGWTEESAADFAALMSPLSNWGRWGPEDELGTLNLLTAEHAASAARAVDTGQCVPLGRPLTVRPAQDDPQPLLHLMKSSGESAAEFGGSHASDWLGLAYHGFAVTHLDAHSHQFFNGQMYNGRPAELVSTRTGAACGSVLPLSRGLVGRGVLLDAPRWADRQWLEPGEGLDAADLDAIAASQRTQLRPADLLLVRTGRDTRAAAHGIIDPMVAGSPGLRATALPWLREHDIAVLGSDAQNDVMRAGANAHPMPVHAGALTFLGLPLLDNLLLEELATACATHGRWDFQLVVAPLALSRCTGSPVNPIGIL